MTDEPGERGIVERITAIASSAIGALTPLGLALLGADPATAALAGVVAQTGADAVRGSVGQAAKARADVAGRELFVEIKARLDATDDAQQKRRIVEEYAADPKRDDLLLEGWKVLFAAPDPAAWPALRRLAIDYWADGRSPDAFYRDTSAMLAGSVADDIVAMRVLVREAVGMMEPQADEEDEGVHYAEPATLSAMWPSGETGEPRPEVNPRRAMKLLVTHGFVRHEGVASVHFAGRDHEPLRRLARLLI